MARLAFIDTETTGLDPVRNEIIEIAFKIIDTEKVETERECVRKFKIRWKDRADPKALEINGYNEEEWQNASSWGSATCGSLIDLLHDCVIVGHNVEFDLAFIREECKRQGVWCPRFATLDTKGMARFLWADAKSISMDNIRKDNPEHFVLEGSHRAMKDVDDCITIWNLFANSLNKNR